MADDATRPSPHPAALPYLTGGLAGIGGLIKQELADFRVEEIPLYEASGEGTHVYFRVVKAGIPTPAAVERIAKYMGVSPGDIGVAGLKDAVAVTTQRMSLEHADEAKLAAYRDPQMQVTWTGRHTNKLRPGHLAGNRFRIRIREVRPDSLPAARAILEVLQGRGVPNYFGPQRFGARGDTDLLGRALVKGELDEFVAILLGRGTAEDPPDCRAARDAFDTGFYGRALDCWPRHYADERRALATYKRKSKAGPAVAAVDKRMKRLYVSAFQSAIFNDVLSRRLESIDRVLVGDLAQKLDSGGVFTVADAEVEQPRASRFEISPTGPIVGYRSHLADGEPGRAEREAVAARGVDLEDFRRVGPLRVKGSRRALRFRIEEVSLEPMADGLELSFVAPPGCYATVVLREIMKND
jgi:tRNA pseudouridine13 synthase